MPHLNQFQQQYAARGFTVISVSDEDEFKIASYSKSHGAKYPVARALGVGRRFGNTAVPHAWLISANGTVIWHGHPNSLTTGTIESALGGAAIPAATQGLPAESDDSWWIWLIVGPGILFASAMGWFLWSTRDRTARYQTQFLPQQQYAPQPQPQDPTQAFGQPPAQPYAQAQPGQLSYPNNPIPQPFPQQPGQPPSYPMQEPFQQMGYSGSPSQGRVTRLVAGPHNHGLDGAMESPGAGGKAEPPPLEQRPFIGQNPDEFPPFDASRNPPRQW